jgi:hypothetical protein
MIFPPGLESLTSEATLTTMTSTVSIDAMRPKLLDLDAAHARLATTEPVQSVPFVASDAIRWIVNEGWNDDIESKKATDLVDAFVRVPNGDVHQLTKEALLEAGAKCGLPKAYVTRSPADLTQVGLNYWYQRGLAGQDFQLLVTGDTVSALTKSTITPFSNLRLMDEIVAGLEDHYGLGEILVDYKLNHSLNETYVRLILPNASRNILGTGTDDDTWSLGVQFRNSLTGKKQTEVSGYLFRWWCTNGATSTHASGIWSRKTDGQGDDVYDWAKRSVDEVLGGLEGALDEIQAMAHMDLTGEMNVMAQDVLNQYKIPLAQRNRIVENLVDEDQMTMYGLMQAVTSAANDATMDTSDIDRLLRVGGDLPHAATNDRCESCRRISIN